jgi:hypothetical protein
MLRLCTGAIVETAGISVAEPTGAAGSYLLLALDSLDDLGDTIVIGLPQSIV